MENEHQWPTCEMKTLLREQAYEETQRVLKQQDSTTEQHSYCMTNKSTNNGRGRGGDFSEWGSHVKYRVTDKHFYSVTAVAGLSFCSEGMAR